MLNSSDFNINNKKYEIGLWRKILLLENKESLGLMKTREDKALLAISYWTQLVAQQTKNFAFG